jgi:hypothetical protein
VVVDEDPIKLLEVKVDQDQLLLLILCNLDKNDVE